MYHAILNADFHKHDSADYKISSLASRQYFIHPFISTQKEFGYSDVTTKNNGTDRVEDLFINAEKNAAIIKRISTFYKKIPGGATKNGLSIDWETLTISTFIIIAPERAERRVHITNEFKGRTQFHTTIVNVSPHNNRASSLWQSIRKVIQMAVDNDDDVIVLCHDNHEFTPDYSPEYFLKNIVEAHEQGCDYLSGGTPKFEHAVPVGPNRFWTDHCLSIQFIVLYRKFFRKVLDEPLDDTVMPDIKLSKMTSHKMILHPFVSRPRDFNSKITPIHNMQKSLIQRMFVATDKRLSKLREVYNSLPEMP